MKKIIVILIFMLPVSAFARIDIEAFGGYQLRGSVISDSENSNSLENISSGSGGLRLHLSGDMMFMFGYGVGLFAEWEPFIKSDPSFSSDKGRSNSYGMDLYLKINQPIPYFRPYIRGGFYILNNYSITTENKLKQNISFNNTAYFNGGYAGLGMSFTPTLRIIDIQIFGEFIYHITEIKNYGMMYQPGFNFGVMFSF